MAILTIGHSNHSALDFAQMLLDNDIDHLIDVRSKPASRFCPHFNKAALAELMDANEIRYHWGGEPLGGYAEDGPRMASYLDRLYQHYAIDNPDKRAAFMCAERPPTECHRFFFLANYLVRKHDYQCEHIMYRAPLWKPALGEYPDLPDFLVPLV